MDFTKPIFRQKDMILCGHRGDRTGADENTMAAFRRAVENGCDMIETDVHRTKDGVIVLNHDSLIPGAGEIKDLTYTQLKEKKPDLTMLTELIELAKQNPGLGLLIELKDVPPSSPGSDRAPVTHPAKYTGKLPACSGKVLGPQDGKKIQPPKARPAAELISHPVTDPLAHPGPKARPAAALLKAHPAPKDCLAEEALKPYPAEKNCQAGLQERSPLWDPEGEYPAAACSKPDPEGEQLALTCADQTAQILLENGLGNRVWILSFSGKLLEYVYKKYGDAFHYHAFYPWFVMGDMETDPADYCEMACMQHRYLDDAGYMCCYEDPLCPESWWEEVLAMHMVPIGAPSLNTDENYIEALKRGCGMINANDPVRTKALVQQYKTQKRLT